MVNKLAMVAVLTGLSMSPIEQIIAESSSVENEIQYEELKVNKHYTIEGTRPGADEQHLEKILPFIGI